MAVKRTTTDSKFNPVKTGDDAIDRNFQQLARYLKQFSGNEQTALDAEATARAAVAAAAITDHGGLGGLTDDDHTQYLLVDGSRALTGDLKHGDRERQYSFGSGLFMDAASGFLAETRSGNDWYGGRFATGVGDIFAVPLDLHTGDRVKSVTFRYFANGTGNVRISVLTKSATALAGGAITEETALISATSYQTQALTVSPNLTQGTGIIWAQIRSGQSGDIAFTATVTYDRP